jgi:hypothetical protein
VIVCATQTLARVVLGVEGVTPSLPNAQQRRRRSVATSERRNTAARGGDTTRWWVVVVVGGDDDSGHSGGRWDSGHRRSSVGGGERWGEGFASVSSDRSMMSGARGVGGARGGGGRFRFRHGGRTTRLRVACDRSAHYVDPTCKRACTPPPPPKSN